MDAVPLSTAPMRQPLYAAGEGRPDVNASGVSWPAVFGGATITAAISFILLALGAGLGLSSISPWSGAGASSTVIGTGAIVWLIAMQVMSGSFGGYLAGRLRTKWPTLHTDEVYFRDTAHGFLSWCFAVVVTGAFLSTAATALIANAADAPAKNATSTAAPASGPDAYYVDMLLRPTATALVADSATHGTPAMIATPETRAEMGRIFMRAMAARDVVPGDRAYAAQVIAAHSGLSLGAADARLSDVLAMSLQAADGVRKAAAHTLLWIFVALLVGAFFSSLAATIGGRQRDNVIIV